MRKKAILLVLFLVTISPLYAYAKGSIVINIPSRTLEVYNDSKFIKQYKIAVGRPSYDSPIGRFSVITKLINPIWAPKGKKPVMPGPDNPLGIRWIGFYSDYGIHGNNNPKSIGTYASKGCIRMYNYDVSEVYKSVDIGSSVYIYYNTVHTFLYPDKERNVMIVYPDIYKRNVNKLSTIKQKLTDINIIEQIPQGKLDYLYKKINNQTVAFSKNWTLFVNGSFLSSDTYVSERYNDTESKQGTEIGKKVMVNINDVNWYLGLDLAVKNNKVMYGGREIYHEIHNGTTYIRILDCVYSIEGYFAVDNSQERIDWVISFGKYNNKFFRLNIKSDVKVVYARLSDLLNVLKVRYSVNEDNSVVTVNDKQIDYKTFDNDKYITLENIKEYFNVDVGYSAFNNMIEISDIKTKSDL